MLPVGAVRFARIGGTGRRDIAAGAIGKAGEVAWYLVLVDERGVGAIARHLRRGNTTPSRGAERWRRGRLDVNFGVLLDDLGHFSIISIMSDDANLWSTYGREKTIEGAPAREREALVEPKKMGAAYIDAGRKSSSWNDRPCTPVPWRDSNNRLWGGARLLNLRTGDEKRSQAASSRCKACRGPHRRRRDERGRCCLGRR